MISVEQQLRTLKELVTSGAIRNEKQSLGANTAIEKMATANSQAISLNDPIYAVENKLATSCNAGKYHAQWIEIDFVTPQTITGIKLVPLTQPDVNLIHSMLTSKNHTNYTEVTKFYEYVTNNKTLLEFFPQKISGVRYVKVKTTTSSAVQS
ncbi:MAG: hypothetical protein KatS3mg088_656 [Patescibacteria group bacterium]|nr:MAG: hypothetical protein KatS3mg088_656 [Patescibacteria group bacterium]